MTYHRLVYNQFVTFSYGKTIVDSWYKRFLGFFGLLPEFKFKAVDNDSGPVVHIGTVCSVYSIREHICPREAIYGVISYTDSEVVGFRIYGVHDGWRYLNPVEIHRYCAQRGLPLPIMVNDC